MNSRMLTGLLLFISSLFLSACASGPCRQMRQPELAAQQTQKTAPAATTTPATPPSSSATSGVAPISEQNKLANAQGKTTALVYKPDGSLQCGAGKGTSVQEMEKQLNGLQVFSRDKRSDGLMHIQVCGSPTGMINVFEILTDSLVEAEKRGFRRFDPR